MHHEVSHKLNLSCIRARKGDTAYHRGSVFQCVQKARGNVVWVQAALSTPKARHK